MGSIRRSRTARPARRAYRLTARDLQLLRAVGRLVYATTEMLALLFFGGLSTCSRRMAKLVALLHLAVRVPRRDGPNIYRLTKRGHDLLAAEGFDPDELHLGSRQQYDDLRHTLLGNELRVRLVVAVRARPEVTIERLFSDADLRRVAGLEGTAPPYIPDLLVRLATQRGPVGLVVEADTGSESVPYFIAHKIRPLHALHLTRQPVWGLTPWRPVVIVPDARRLRALAEAVVKHGDGTLWLGTELGVLRDRGALGAAFATFAEIAATPRRDPIAFTRTLIEPIPGVP